MVQRTDETSPRPVDIRPHVCEHSLSGAGGAPRLDVEAESEESRKLDKAMVERVVEVGDDRSLREIASAISRFSPTRCDPHSTLSMASRAHAWHALNALRSRTGDRAI